MEKSDSVAEDDPTEAKGTAASKAIRKNFPKLSKAVTRGDILEELYAQELIDQQTFEIYTNPSLTDRDKGRKILLEVQNTVEIQPGHFDTFCSILNEESDVTKDLSKRLRESYEKILEASQKKEKAKRPTIEPEEFKKLKNELDVYTKALAKAGAPEEALFTCIRESIRRYVEVMLETDGSVASLEKQMSDLCYEHFLIPSKLTEWVSRVVETVSSDRSPDQTVVNPEPQVHEQTKPQEPPLFNKDTVYHASLCCHAVSTCNAGNFKQFFDHIVRRHCLEEVSMSVSKDKENVDRYLVAKQLNTIYVAFQSEATISQWMDKYSSFDDGLEKQRERIPVRFLEELLVWDHKRIVLTGFSFGGMLACCIAANIWKRSQISTDVLKDRVICINFGQPLINMPFVQEVIKDCQQFETTIYSMFSKEDVIPGLLRFFTVGCLHCRSGSNTHMKALTAANGTKAADKPLQPVITLPADGPKVDFKAPFAAVFLKNLASLQDSVHPEHTYSGAMSQQNAITEKALGDLKEALHQVIPYAEVDPDVVLGNCYLTVSEEGHGITSNLVSKRMVVNELGFPTVEKLETSLFRKHNMKEYRQSLLRGFLEKSLPKYSLPGPAGSVKEVGFLKPNINTVEVHKYPDEVAVVLEGDNLWFCHQISLGTGDNIPDIPKLAEHIARRSIQFNFCLSKHTAKIVNEDGYVKVTLFSHFANPIRRRVKAELEPEHSISLRQMQLAKHTPSEVIELAYLGAMLECHSQHEVQLTTSKRFKEVARFLQEAVQVVPLESIFFAIAYSDDDSNTALECAKALKKSRLQVPPSEMMLIGSQKAAYRMRTGIRPEVLDHYAARALAELSVTLQSLSPPPSRPHRSSPSPKSTYQTSSKPSYSDITRRSAPVSASQILLPEAFLPTMHVNINVKNLPPGSHGRAFPEVADYMEELSQTICERAVAKGSTLDVVCKPNIEHIYPADAYRRHTMYGTLQSPLDVLKDARKQLASFVEELQQDSSAGATVCTQTTNEQMLEFVREIREDNLKICAALLGSFMEQQIHIPLLNSPMDTAKVLSSRSAPVAVGVWALFSMSHFDLQRMLSSTQGNSLTVEIADYIAGIFDPKLKHPESKHTKQSDSKYAGKLQFMLQGIKKTVSCSTQYISYSLERQLCNNPKVNESIKSIKVKDLIDDWDKIFKGDALSLVAKSHRPLIARWMKWAILVHDLREALASYMCVGVIGLINSGKSQLVNTLFKVQAQVGTIKSKRTTVPLLYNLDGKVDGLDVIDFPGVDDKDQSIPQLANLLLGLVQAVIFVVHRGKFSSGQVAIEQWLCELKAEDVPVLLCLTHADRLYAECIDHDGTLEPTPYKCEIIEADLTEKRNEIGHHPSWAVHHYCFHLPEDSKLKHEHLKEVGIGFPEDVGEWIVKTFRQKLDQKDLADRLKDFLQKQEQSSLRDQAGIPQSHSLQDQDSVATMISSPIGSAGGSIHWEEYGVDIEIPPGAITSDVCQHFHLTCYVPEKAKFQESCIPVGPLFNIGPSCEFQKNISISFKHWVDSIESTNIELQVLCAPDLEAFSTGRFTELPHVGFDDETVTTTCDHFCFLCPVMRILKRGTCSYKYIAVLHLPQKCIPGETWTAVFSISRKSRVYAEALKKTLEKKCKHEYCYQHSTTIHFSRSKVATLNIPVDDAESQGYHVKPSRPFTQMGLEPTQISKNEVDNPIDDQNDVNPPRILLRISARDPSTIPTKPLRCTLRLEGIIEQEETTIYLKVPPDECYGLQHLTSSTSDSHTDGVGTNSPVHSSVNGTGRAVPSKAPTIDPADFPEIHDIKLVTLKSREDDDNLISQVEALLMVVNQNELRAVIGLMKPISGNEGLIQVNRNDVTFLIGVYGLFVSAIVQTSPGGAGADGAERKTVRAIEVVNPFIVIGVGVAFGKDEESQQLGDVIVGTVIQDYTYQRIGPAGKIRNRSAQPSVNPSLLDIFRNSLGWRTRYKVCNVTTAPLISGPNLIDNPEIKKQLFQWFPDAKGGEMEGAAILHAIQGSKAKVIIVKAICDWGDGKKQKDWQPFAAHAAASYVLHQLRNRGTYDQVTVTTSTK